MDFLSQLAGYEVTYVELLATVFGFAYLWLNIRQNVWCWPAGLVSVALFIAVFYEARLYADALLQGIYVVLSLYGWYEWLHGGTNHDELPVSRIRPRTAIVATVVGLALWSGMGWGFSTLTNADLPYLDSFTTAASLVATWMSARKYLENWAVWFVTDSLYVGIYIYKELYLTTILFAIYVVMVVQGYLAWKRTMQADPAAAPA